MPLKKTPKSIKSKPPVLKVSKVIPTPAIQERKLPLHPQWLRFKGRDEFRLHIKDDLLKALKANHGILSRAVKAVGISRSTALNYINQDPDYKKKVDDITEECLDYVEGKLYELIDLKEPSAIYFTLKCKGKKRGYIEQTNIGIMADTPQQSIEVGGKEIIF